MGDFVGKARKQQPFRHSGTLIGRNTRCPCNSGRKFKHCHGRGNRPAKLSGSATLAQVYGSNPVLREAAEVFVRQWGFVPQPALLRLFMDGDNPAVKATIVSLLRGNDADAKFIAAVEKAELLATPLNTPSWTPAEVQRWREAIEPTEEKTDVQHVD